MRCWPFVDFVLGGLTGQQRHLPQSGRGEQFIIGQNVSRSLHKNRRHEGLTEKILRSSVLSEVAIRLKEKQDASRQYITITIYNNVIYCQD